MGHAHLFNQSFDLEPKAFFFGFRKPWLAEAHLVNLGSIIGAAGGLVDTNGHGLDAASGPAAVAAAGRAEAILF